MPATPNASVVYQSYFAVNTTVSSPDQLRTFATSSTAALLRTKDSSYVQWYQAPGWPLDRDVIESIISLDSYAYTTQINPMTVLDLIGKWGAFFSVIAAILGLVGTTWNDREFYLANPHWDRIGPDFEVAHEHHGDSEHKGDPGPDANVVKVDSAGDNGKTVTK